MIKEKTRGQKRKIDYKPKSDKFCKIVTSLTYPELQGSDITVFMMKNIKINLTEKGFIQIVEDDDRVIGGEITWLMYIRTVQNMRMKIIS